MGTMATVIDIDHLYKTFGKLTAVNNVSLQVEQSEIFGFLGPNGAGKSTAIRCMMGFIRPSAGTVSILGYDMAHDAEQAKRHIGYLPGNVQLYDTWTGWDHIRFFESVRGLSPLRNELIERLGYNPNVKTRQLSSGNKQKLGLILALMHKPEVLIMDEPTVGLDPLLQNEIYNILKDMRAKGVTIFISSHNLPEVQKLCDRIALIKDGKLVTVATIADLAQRNVHELTVEVRGDLNLQELAALPGVANVHATEHGATATVTGDLDPVVQLLAQYNVQDLNIEHASLEDVFIQYYKKGGTTK